MLFTTSWDDGHPDDCGVAALLEQYGATGTFYLCKTGARGAHLSEAEIRSLARKHDIGAHTLTHPSLPTLSPEDAEREIRGSKQWLEDLLQKDCALFAYPFGHFDKRIRDLVEAAGFRGARTTEDLQWKSGDPFTLSTSVQVHHFPFRPVWNRRFVQPIRSLWPELQACGISLFHCRNWFSMATAAWHYAVKTEKPWFHLWGHSWSLTEFHLWKELEAFLQFVQEQKNVTHVTNRTLLQTNT